MVVPSVPNALPEVGPDYPRALSQGASSPNWRGGVVRLHVPNVIDAFKETCCYQLGLRAYKRTILNCDGNFAHNNLSEYSFTVII